MKAQILKIAGVKSEKEFYKKYPSEEAFMKQHGKEFKKAQMGAAVNAEPSGFKPINYSDQFDQADKLITGSTGSERQAALEKQQAIAAQKDSGGGFDIGGLMKMASSLGGESGGGGEMDLSSLASGKYGRVINKAQNGGGYYNNSYTGFQTGFGSNPGPSGPSVQPLQSVNQMTSAGVTGGGISAPQVPQYAGMQPNAPQENGWTKTAGMLGKYAGPVGDIIGGIGALQQEKEAAKAAKQTKLVSDVSLQAATSTDVDARRQMQDTFSKQRSAMMQPNININAGGVGTNVLGKNGLQLKGGGEIQNTYAPDTLFDDLGYEPLNDSNTKQYYHGGRIHQMQDGGGTPWGAISSKATGLGQELMGGQNAGGKIGGTAGKAIGNAIVPGLGGAVGEFIGGIAGNALDPYGKRIKKDNAATQRNMQGMASANMAKGIQSQNQSYMEDGGWVSNDWTPQVIASFGDHSAKDVYDFAHEGMDNLRSGGNLRDYTPPSERAMETYEDGGEIESYALGGELRTTRGGEIEKIAQNDNLPYGGQIFKFNGASHKKGGIDVEFGNAENGAHMDYAEDGEQKGMAKVNVQGGEPAYKDVHGNLNVLGALKFMPKVVELTGDPELMELTKKYGGMKIQNIGKDLADKMNKTNDKLNKTISELKNFTVRTPIDKLKLNALTVNEKGLTKQSEKHANDLTNVTSFQTSINDTRDDLKDLTGVTYSADKLASHLELVPDKDPITRYSKFGSKLETAQTGWYNDHPIGGAEDYGQVDMEGGQLNEVVIQGRPRRFVKPELSSDIEMPDHINNPYYKDDIRPLSDKALSYVPRTISKDVESDDKGLTPSNPYIDMFNQMLPQIRPTDQEELDAAQLYPEMYAMATNQVQPVQANFYHPELGTSYDISRQAAKNDLIAQTRAAQRQVGYNPAAQAMIAAQAYNPMQQLNEADFIANQANQDKVYGENRNTLNQAKLTNLEIADKQYGRQSEAMSNTKATTQAALNSIADKYAKNKLENRQLGVMENMYNYRYDSKGRIVNMNPLQQFNIQGKAGSSKGKGLAEGKGFTYDENGNIVGVRSIGKEDIGKNGISVKAKNGSIVKSYKNL